MLHSASAVPLSLGCVLIGDSLQFLAFATFDLQLLGITSQVERHWKPPRGQRGPQSRGQGKYDASR